MSFNTSVAQSESDVLKKANKLMSYNFPDTYKSALDLLIGLDEKSNGNNPVYRYKIAVCYLNTNVNKQKSLEYLLSIMKNRNEFGYGFYYYLGQAYHYSYKFDEAIASFNQFLQLARRKDRRKFEVYRAIEICKTSKAMQNNPLDVDILNLGSVVNSNGSDNTPVISADESLLLFTSRREGCIGGKMDVFGQEDKENGEFFEDIFISYKVRGNWLKPMNIGSHINTKVHDAVIGLSHDGQKMYIYKSDNKGMGNIYVSHLKGDRWTKGEKLPAPINSDYWEGSCSITPDGNTIYFASNRPGGYGGKDIYKSKRRSDGSWSEPENLGPSVNTLSNEDAPFIHVDGKSLYFSSKGHDNMGGYDIYKSQFKNGAWSQALNMAYPINTVEDDINFVLSADGQRGYYSVTRENGMGEQDIYMVDLKNEESLKPSPVTLLKGKVTGAKGEIPQQTKIHIQDQSGNEFAVYTVNEVSGKYLVVLPELGKYKLKVVSPGYKEYWFDLNVNLKDTQKPLKQNFLLYKL